MQQAYDQFGPIAASLRISFQESTAVLDTLNQQFNSGTASGTALKYILQSFVSPTQQAANEFAALGLIAMDQTNPALQQLEAQLRASGSAGQAVADAFDGSGGTVTAFQAMYKEAQKLGLAQSDMNFQAWATKVGAMNDALFNSKGQFIGLENALQLIHDKMTQAGMSTHDVTQALELLFSKTGAKGALALLQDWTATEAKLKQVNAGLATHGTAATKAAQITSTFKIQVQELQTSFKDLAAEVGLQLLPILTLLVSHLNSFIGFLQKLGPHFTATAAITLLLGVAITGLTFIISTAIFLFGLLDAILLPVLAVLGILIGVVALVAAGVILMRQHWQQIAPVLMPIISAFRSLGSFLGTVLGNVFRDVGNDLRGLWTILGQAVGPLLPRLQSTWHNLVTAFQSAMPVWKLLGAALLVVGAVLGGVLVGAIQGVVFGLATLLKGLLLILTGAARVFSGIMQVVMGFLTLVISLFQLFFQLLTGQNLTALNHLKDAWNSMKNGVVDIAKGLWNIVGGLFTAVLGTIISTVVGFVMGIIHWFQHLFDTLVGHSIVTDLVHTIVTLFQWLFGAGPAIIAAIVSAVIVRFESLFSSVTSQASGFVGRVRGVLGAIGGVLQGVVGAFQSMAGGISGAISTALGWINNLTGAISGAIAAASNAGHSIGSALHIPGFAGGGIVTSPTFAMVGEGGEPEVILPVSKMIQAAQLAANSNQGTGGTTTVNLLMDGQTVGRAVIDRVSGQLIMNGAGRAMN